MAAATLPRLVAVAALVALMCAVAVQAQKVPAAGGAPSCDIVDQNVVNACFKSFSKGMRNAYGTPAGDVDCCVVFGGHSCLCKMKKIWEKQGKTGPGKAPQDNVPCVQTRVC
ncbi:unnamed protein product [Alopecurus aequalis]